MGKGRCGGGQCEQEADICTKQEGAPTALLVPTSVTLGQRAGGESDSPGLSHHTAIS